MITQLYRWNQALMIMGAIMAWTVGTAAAEQSPQIPLAGKAIPQFVQPLPLLNVQTGGTMQTLVGSQPITLRMCEFDASVLPPGTPLAAGASGKTKVWGYINDTGTGCPTTPQDTYIGPVIVNERGTPTPLTYINDLGSAATTNVLAYKYSTDQTLHWADPLTFDQTMANACMMKVEMSGWTVNGVKQYYPPPGDPCAQNYAGPVAAVPHLHGGEVPPEIDGSPDSWFTSDGSNQGHKYYSAAATGNSVLYKYPNTQEAGPLWFHDHTLGATRLNVYAGLAGGYFIEDPAILPTTSRTTLGTLGTCTSGCLPANLQPIADVIPVVIQDRMFDTSGQLFFQADSAGGILWALNPEHPYWSPEFVGDTIVVNGKAWPFLTVEAKRYRFLFLNGSNARTYELSIPNGPPLWVIGTDGGYLDVPVKLQKLTIMPGERYEVIIDFGSFAKKNLIVTNTGRTPYPKGPPPNGATLGRVMQFRVGALPTVADASYNPATLVPLRAGANAIVRLTTAGALPAGLAKTRTLTLNEVMGMAKTAIDPVTGVLTAYPGGPMEILVNNTKWNGLDTGSMTPRADFTPMTVNGITTYFSETPREGDTEVWEVVNLTADAHPIHLHLIQFQLINRQNFNASNYAKAYAAAFPGGSFNMMTGLPYPAGVFMPGFGPPKDYRATLNPLSGTKDGGNPDPTPYLQDGGQLPLPHEQGWKDTVIMYPGQVTRIAVRWAPTTLPLSTPASALAYPFDPSGGGQFNYVWHCHIIDHEDNEMMRPSSVLLNPLAPAPASRPLVKGVSY